ncbi:DUF3073 domain-containing protein [Bifidobacterium sp. ESL0763]|uniref:DUF3073 domain-containing protein n=1 Tax=Bifidobacterium sp. ESL0763 TaxID=2983227 RepID=UPI0023F7F98E|nr:DUF3073 domain-containing protein [Bifidobacterium sp. ESL0763]MDF7663107.1 DUF3073 domain-containing protein [Bifidobacterium sp. ESL0763]
MGRGRQKAKQKKIARKLKYLTTDTDYDELARELGAKEPGSGAKDPFEEVEEQYGRANRRDAKSQDSPSTSKMTEQADSAAAPAEDDLDDYAKWAAEAAAKAMNQGGAKAAEKKAAAKPHKPIHMPVPSALRKPRPSQA